MAHRYRNGYYVEQNLSQPVTYDPVVDDYLDTIKSGELYGRGSVSHIDTLALAKHQVQLDWSVRTLKSELGPHPTKTAERALDAVKDTAETLRSFIVQLLGSDPTITAPSAASAEKAQQVFEVPELAEAILCRLSAADLFAVTRVNRALSAIATSSPRLQMVLGLRPNNACYWWSNFDSTRRLTELFRGFGCTIGRRAAISNQPLDRAEVTAGFDWYGTRLPRVGSRGRAMLVCQPPIKEMSVEPACCKFWRNYTGLDLPPPPAFTVVKSNTGLTVGDLLDATAAANHAHRHCPYANRNNHDDRTGLVISKVYFTGYMALLPGDPELPPCESPSEVASGFRNDYYDDDTEEYTTPPDAIRDYMSAKHNAILNGEAIPTFATFQARRGIGGGARNGAAGTSDGSGEHGDEAVAKEAAFGDEYGSDATDNRP